MKLSKHLLCFGFILLLCLPKAEAALPDPAEENKGILIFVRLKVERKLAFDIDARLWDNKVYLPAKQLFSVLKIESSFKANQITVRFPNPENPVHFDLEKQVAEGPKGSTVFPETAVIQTKDEVFILRSLLEKLLGMDIIFDFRKLQVMLYADNTLPVIEFYERKKRYENISESTEKISPELIFPARHYLFKGWIADWSINSSHSYNDFNYSYNLGLGGHFLGGNLTLRGSGSKQHGLHWQRLRGRWEYSIYSSPIIKQVRVGDLSVENSLGLGATAFRGITVTNRPNAPIREFSTFHYSGILNEGWDSELYVNNQLEDFALSSETQRFRFTAPLHYGSNLIELKYYDPSGFNHQKRYLFYIPHNFLRPGRFQYTLSAGKYSTFADQVFGRLDTRLGVSSNITVGGGTIMKFSDHTRQLLPFAQTWFRLGSGIIANGRHVFNYLSGGSLRMAFSGSQLLRIDINKYYRSSIFNKTGKSLEASFNTSFPIDLSFLNLSAFISSRFTRYHSDNQNLNIYSGISMDLPLGINMRVNNRLLLRNEGIEKFRPAQFSSEVHLSKRILQNLLLRPSLRYSHRLQKITDFGLKFRLRVTPRSYLNFSFQRNNLLDNNRFMVSFKLDLPFVRHNSFARAYSGSASFYQNTTGSIVFSSQSRNLLFEDQRQTGKAGFVLDPFLDLNNNGQKDKNEPPVKNVTADVYRQGQASASYNEQKIIKNLIPYERYILRINESGLTNPLWKAKHKTYSVQALPNLYKTIPVPIIVTGEVAGKISMIEESFSADLYGLDITINSLDGSFTESIKTYSGGNFYYVGLMPGKYEAVLNQKQLEKFSLKAVKDTVRFKIEATRLGDIVDGLSFSLRSINANQFEPLKELFAIQIGAFRQKENAVHFVEASELKTDYKVTVIFNTEQKLFKCRIGFFKSRSKAEQVLKKLSARKGLYQDAFIVKERL